MQTIVIEQDEAYLARSRASVWHIANDNTAEDPGARTADYRAAMAEWHARQARAKEASARYYAGGAKVSIDGTPCRVAFQPSKHMLAMMRIQGASHNWGMPTKAFREMAETRYPQTTYTTAGEA